MKKILYYSMLLMLVSCFHEKLCPDELEPDFPVSNLDWFSYLEGDTLFYKDALTQDTFYLTCYSRADGLDSTFKEDQNCIDDGYYMIQPYMNHEFQTNFPHFDNSGLYLTFMISGSPNSILNMKFRNRQFQTHYGSFLLFDYQDIAIKNLYQDGAEAHYLGSTSINNRLYNNVYVISDRKRTIDGADLYYDSVYYNQDGFLKFISSEHGTLLERLPE